MLELLFVILFCHADGHGVSRSPLIVATALRSSVLALMIAVAVVAVVVV